MSRKSPVKNSYTGVLAALETEIAGLPAIDHLSGLSQIDRIRAIAKYQKRVSHLQTRVHRRLWKLSCQARHALDKELAAVFIRRAGEESDPAKKAELRRMAYEVRHPQSSVQ